MDITVHKIFTYDKEQVRVTCPQCGIGKDIQLSTINNPGKHIRVKCSCGFVFGVVFERRRHYRKPVNIPGRYTMREFEIEGRYTMQGSNPRTGIMTIIDLSQSGVGFRLQGGHLEEGDELIFEFRLDNPNHTLITCNVVVCSVHQEYVGARIVSIPSHCKNDLGFYLMP